MPTFRPLLSLALAAALTACAPAHGPVVPAALQGGSLSALADFPMIDGQIRQAILDVNDHGTRVKALPVPDREKPVTFLTYKALDNNLGITLPMHLNVLERAGSSLNVNALAVTDDVGPANSFVYYLRQDQDPENVTSPYVPAIERGDLNTGHPENLKLAIQWGFGRYPSKLRWLDVNNHGAGYAGIAQDDRHGTRLSLPQLGRAVREGAGDRPLDVISFDACLMASAEVAFELKGSARVMVASEDLSYALGMNYDKTLKAIAEKPPASPEALARALVLRAERKGEMKALYTISAIDLSKAERVARAVDRLAGALLSALPAHAGPISRAMGATRAFYVGGADRADFDHRDLHALCEQLRARVPDAKVHQAVAGVREALFGEGKAVMMTLAAPEEEDAASGLSIYLPAGGKVDPAYRETAFARATRWDEFLAAVK